LQLTEKKLLLALTKSWKIFVKVETNMISATAQANILKLKYSASSHIRFKGWRKDARF